MKNAHYEKQTGKILGWYDKDIHESIPDPNIEVTEDQWQIAIDNGHNKVNSDGTTEHFDFRTDEEKTADALNQKISETNAYLALTDWVEPFLIRHELGIEILPDDSNKWAIKAKRDEARAFLQSN